MVMPKGSMKTIGIAGLAAAAYVLAEYLTRKALEAVEDYCRTKPKK